MNWRTTVLGILILFSTYASQIGAKVPETREEWTSFAFGFLVFCGLTVAKDPEWLKRLTGAETAGQIARLLLVVSQLVLIVALFSGCSGLGILQNPASDPSSQLAIMKQENARGCIYFRGNATPWADVKTVIVGTWGQNPPLYAECWQGLPSGF